MKNEVHSMKIAIVDLLGLCYDGTTLSKQGLGGSESAVILISKELVKLGFQVDVYNNCNDSKSSSGVYDGVRYIDHTEYKDAHPTYDVFISSRSVFPFFVGHQYAKMANDAKHKVLWMHDTFCQGDEHIENMLTSGAINELFTLSDWHTSYVTTCAHGPKRMFEVLKKYIWQTRNGAVKHIEEVDLSKKDRNHFVYNASATKGLLPLLRNIWPEVKKNIPTAKLTCIGGFYRFREGAEPDEQEKTVRDLMDNPDILSMDVKFTGVISQQEIAEILADASFMLYPPDFPETFGISSLESLLYKTPIITGNFGALEETAIDMACYKVDYPAVPNGLYPHIDATSQAKKFVQTVIRAYNDTYLHQQKQNYCDVVTDIAGWDTVALQWKQHLYKKMNVPLSVLEYESVSRINDKVARVFGRRFMNQEQTTEYRSSGKQRRIVIVSPFWNAANYIENHILSVAQQSYDNYTHILIDDASDDDSYAIATKTISTLPLYIQDKFRVLKNKKNVGAIANQLKAFDLYVENDDIVMLLDGDDWLVNNNTLFHYYNDLYSDGYDFTYGSMWSFTDNIPLIAQDYPKDVILKKSYRDHKFNWGIPYTHLRTFNGSLLETLGQESFKVDGEWMKAGADNPLFYELIERASHPYAVKEIMVNYNDMNPLNDYKIRGEEQNMNASTSIAKKNMKTKSILIAVPTNKYVETDTMKSIYDLDIPEGYTTELQFFYGYQVDQIRNLIADWAKNYDYLFSVDSDIVLPQDSLRKMINADKHLVSGLYIQRISNTHTLEVYKDNGIGGTTNIPYEEIQGRGLVQIAGCGFGCALIKGEVFRNMEYPHFVYKSALDHKNTISEDIYFCAKARSLGYELYADTSIICDHIGNTKFRVGDFPKPSLPQKTHVQTIAEIDLLPAQHAEYLKKMSIEPKVIYDIGASLLHWTKKAKEVWPNAEYFLADATETTREFLAASGYPYHVGVLSDEDGKLIKFYEDPHNPGGNSYYKENTPFYDESHAKQRITLTLDTVTAKLPKPDLIKIDVQGAELDILRGGMECLKNAKDVILEAQHVNYNEGAPKVEEVIEFMKQNGFELVSRFCYTDVDGDYHFRRVQ
jgi:FkbM family methyltransferase